MIDEFTPEELRYYEDFLDRLEEHGLEVLRKTDATADAQCGHPDHPDERPSMGVDLAKKGGKARVLINCRSRGCDADEILGAVGMSKRDLFVDKADFAKTKKVRSKVPGCTLEQYATAKCLGVDYLSNGHVGLERSSWSGLPAVKIPYRGEGGEVVAERFRVGMEKDKPRVMSRKDESPPLYGLHRLAEFREKFGYVLLCEGESDIHTAWAHDLPAVGVPGANNWKSGYASKYFDGLKILVAVEPDGGGEKLWAAISSEEALEGRVGRVVFELEV